MGNSHSSSPHITARDLERWHREGRPVMIEQTRRRRSPGGHYHDERRHRWIERDDDRHRGRRSGGRGHRRDASPSFLFGGRAGRRANDGFFAAGRRPGEFYHDPMSSADRPRGSERGPRFGVGRGPAVVEELGFHRFPPPPSCHRPPPPRRPPVPPPSFGFRGPWGDIPPPAPSPPPAFRSRRMPPHSDHPRAGGPYMLDGLRRGDPVGGALAQERAYVGFRPEYLSEDSRTND
ncbi:uncharacterized protein A1O5_08827 [Cladophialophora psammophila CBS 110553]|uniref:Uncharacterized protein n=1 Tax=Cladophialophora psammophila CBS 110553 TaxID=1182543 RepID=W9WJA2_9EURO|nr:uncharacterized protein A1O5_08827 [Cladophialophora psammophila CBS 110553]EXJ68212.1 hypothetical protein A1O5_08827 [Cladophialophora psammophila CBS 110553]